MTGYLQPFLSRPARLGLILTFVLLGFYSFPSFVGAATSPCGIAQTSGGGYFFTSYELLDRTPDGLPIEHFKIDERYTDGRSFSLSVKFFNEECDPSDTNTYTKNITLPAGVADWSVRFATPTHLDVWDDVHETIFASLDLPTVPAYSKILLRASIDGGASTLQTPTLLLVAEAVPPQHVGTLPPPSVCNSLSSQGYLFDGSYEHSEYVNGLLRVHLRLSSPYNDGREFRSIGVTHDGDCNAAVPSIFSYKGTAIPPFVRYYSFRMTSATHYELWNDESETKLICEGCSGDFELNSPYVSWKATIDGNASFVATTPFSPTKEAECCSSVFFLPGFEGSRLYTRGLLGSENQLWEPSILTGQSDAKNLFLDSTGKSIKSVYTKENSAIDIAGIPIVQEVEVYGTFLQQLGALKSNHTISGYKIFGYDWRMSPSDIVESGTMYDSGIHFPTQDLETLAANSTTGKVTIVAHSNGGLVAKALMQRLEREGKSNLVDKVILVAVPQLGTPSTIASMLNGDFQDIPIVLHKETVRGLAENLPSAYGLLPSSAYFAKISTPVIIATSAPNLLNSSGIGNGVISDKTTFKRFVTNFGPRPKPVFSDVETPNVLSNSLYADATTLHDSLDAWVAPPGVQVIQIAGWGLDTPSGITYIEKQKTTCVAETCFQKIQLSHVVNLTEDGDARVVSGSAVTNPFWTTYYLDLINFDRDTGLNKEHLNITGTKPFQELFFDLLSASTHTFLPQYVHTTLPQPTSVNKRLRIRMLSPVSIDAYDNLGNHTGMVQNPNPTSDVSLKEEDIPNSYYEEFGEGKYLGLPADGSYRIELRGLDQGTFTFEVTTTGGGEPDQTLSYQDIPVTASSTGTLLISEGNTTQATFTLDQNGDGIKDIVQTSGNVVNDPQSYVALVKLSVQNMSMGAKTKKQLLAKLSNTERLILKSDKWDDEDDDGREPNVKKGEKITARTIKKIDKISLYLQKELGKSQKKSQKEEQISPAQVEYILNMLSHLKTLVQ